MQTTPRRPARRHFFCATSAPLHAAAYPLKMCVVTGDEIGDTPVDVNYQGRTIRLCCKSCVRKFNANPAKYVAIYDREVAKRKK